MYDTLQDAVTTIFTFYLLRQYRPGIIATVHLTIGSSFGTSEKLLTDIRSVIPGKSTAEPATNTINAEDIVISTDIYIYIYIYTYICGESR